MPARQTPSTGQEPTAVPAPHHRYEDALLSAEELVSLAQQLRDGINKAGSYVVSLTSISQTEQIEKLAKTIRRQLKT